MKKVTRFEALAKGLSLVTTPVKKEQVANVIEKAVLSSKLALIQCDSKIEIAAAVLINNPTEENLAALGNLMQEKADIKKSREIAEVIKEYLEEQVEIDDEKSK